MGLGRTIRYKIASHALGAEEGYSLTTASERVSR